MFGAPFDGMQVLLPGGWAPQLEVVVVAGHDDLALEAGMAGEGGRDEHPALSVQVGLGRPREEERPQLARLARERVERGDAVLDAHLPGLPRVHRDVAVEPAREHDTGTERVAEAARQREPALLVDRVLVGADEHRPRVWPIPFVISTIPHFTPHYPTVKCIAPDDGSRGPPSPAPSGAPHHDQPRGRPPGCDRSPVRDGLTTNAGRDDCDLPQSASA